MTRDSPLGEAQPGEIVVVEKPSGRIYSGIFSPRTATDSRKHVSATTGASIELGQFEIERRRSQVRQRVTYWSITAFLVLAAFVLLWLIWAGRYAGPLGVLGGVAGLAGAIAGFWFGAGKPKEDRSASGSEIERPDWVGQHSLRSGFANRVVTRLRPSRSARRARCRIPGRR